MTVIFMNLSDYPGEKILLDTFDLLFRVGFQDYCISHKVFIKSSCKSQLPQISVNSSFIITNMRNQLTDLCGNWLLQNNFVSAFCERISEVRNSETKTAPRRVHPSRTELKLTV